MMDEVQLYDYLMKKAHPGIKSIYLLAAFLKTMCSEPSAFFRQI